MQIEIADRDLKPGQRVFARLGESLLSGKFIMSEANGIFVTHHMKLDFGPVVSLGGDMPEEQPAWFVNDTPVPPTDDELAATARQARRDRERQARDREWQAREDAYAARLDLTQL